MQEGKCCQMQCFSEEIALEEGCLDREFVTL